MNPQEIIYHPFWDQMLHTAPAFREIFQEHLQTYGKVLDHVLMADLTRLLLQCYVSIEKGDPPQEISRKMGRDILNLLEQFDSEEYEGFHHLIMASFLENLLGEKELPEVKKDFGPRLKCGMELVETFWRNGS